ncbi:MAG: sigma-70 family RNA polymerase sigma factor [Gemmatimonadota bacterium]
MEERPLKRRVMSPGKTAGPDPSLSIVGREESLRNRIAARDESALSELVALTGPWLLGVAHGMLRDTEDAEDVVMETFRIVWRSVQPSTAESRGLLPYLLRVTRHRAIDKLRSRERWQKRLTVMAPDEVERSVVPAVEPNEAAQPGWQLHSQVHVALQQLPDEQRTAVQLAYFQGLTQSEIAGTLGIPLGTVKTRLRLAFGRLRSSLAHARDWVL